MRPTWRALGVYVKDVMDDGAAKSAGVKSGDVIVKVGAMNVDNVPELQEQVGKFSPGDKVAITLVRDGKEEVMDMTLLGRAGAESPTASKDVSLPTLGAELAAATDAELKALRIGNGVKVVRINGGKLRSIGFREGFIITKIDLKPMRSPDGTLALGPSSR